MLPIQLKIQKQILQKHLPRYQTIIRKYAFLSKLTLLIWNLSYPEVGEAAGTIKKKKAHYDHAHKRVVCQTYFICDDIAYARAQHTDSHPPCKDFKTAIDSFSKVLKNAKYKGEMPKTLEDVQKILSSINNNNGEIKKKNAQDIKLSATNTGLKTAIDFKQSIQNINKENTSQHVIVHELEHAKTAQIKEKSLAPETLLSPQDYFLFMIADELNSFSKEGELLKQSQQQVITDFRNHKEANYVERYSQSIAEQNSFWRSATYKHTYAQNLDLIKSKQVTGTAPIIFEDNFTTSINGKDYVVSKCARETDQCWCYTVMEGDNRQPLPTGSIITTPDGKKVEANILYDKISGKPLLNQDGEKIGAHGYDNQDEGWSIKLSSNQLKPIDNFSKKNFENLMTEKFGPKSPDNEYRNLIEKELDRLRQSETYKYLSSIQNPENFDLSYVKECKETPLTKDYVQKGFRYRAAQSDNCDNLIDITDKYIKQNLCNKHFQYARSVLSEQNGEKSLQKQQEISLSTSNNNAKTFALPIDKMEYDR